jgi:hypothetical protein
MAIDSQLRLLALTECGTRALIDAVFDGVEQASAQVLARRLLPSLAPRDAAAGRPELPRLRTVGPGRRDRR